MTPKFENYVRYDPASGCFYWLEDTGKRVVAGSRADHINGQGYMRISIEGRWHNAHRVAWYLMTGVWPAIMVDHRNLVRSDNRWRNLRLATNAQNQMNKANQAPLPKGVTYHRGVGKFQAQIKRGGKSHYLGLFDTPGQANEAYARAAKTLFGEFARPA